jgi:hypothetical protein
LPYHGTDSSVNITVFGDEGETTEHVLDKKFHNDFERNSIERFNLKDASDVGKIQYIQLGEFQS